MPIAPETRLVDHVWTVVDVETTGGQPGSGDRITEFAGVVVQGGRIVEQYASLVQPGRSIPPFIVQLTGISDRMVADAPRFAEIAPRVAELIGRGTFVAHNAPFDWNFVNSELSWAGLSPDSEATRVCTVRLARRLLRELPRRSLDFVCHHYGIAIEGRHRALGDAAATAHVLLRFIDELGRQGVDTWGDLDDYLARRTNRRKRSALPRSTDDTFAA